MEDLKEEQIIELARVYFPEMEVDQILTVFNQVKAAMPEGTTNLEIAQVIKMTVDDLQQNPQRMGKLAGMLGNR